MNRALVLSVVSSVTTSPEDSTSPPATSTALFTATFVRGRHVNHSSRLVDHGCLLEDHRECLRAAHVTDDGPHLTGLCDGLGELVGGHAVLRCLTDKKLGDLGLRDLHVIAIGQCVEHEITRQ